MKLQRPVTDIVRARTSRRRYEPRPIDPAAHRALEESLTAVATPFGSRVRFVLAAASAGDASALRGLGTYGFIRDAPGFVIGAVETGPRDMEDFGYAMEAVILRATDLGLGTCWLGGTFARSEFTARAAVRPGETVPAVVAVGHATAQRGAVERLVRLGAGSRHRHEWEAVFFSGAYGVPLHPARAGRYGDALEVLRLAPSASNKQPWRVVASPDGRTFHLILERTPGYGRDSRFVKTADLQRIDMGIAMCHFALCARESGIAGEWGEPGGEDVGALPPNAERSATWREAVGRP